MKFYPVTSTKEDLQDLVLDKETEKVEDLRVCKDQGRDVPKPETKTVV